MVSCSVKPLAACGPDPEAHQLPAEHTVSEVSEIHLHDEHSHSDEASRKHSHQTPDSNSCADDKGCEAIASAFPASEKVSVLPASYLLITFQFLADQIPVKPSLFEPVRQVPEAVLVLTHEVCTIFASFSNAPPA